MNAGNIHPTRSNLKLMFQKQIKETATGSPFLPNLATVFQQQSLP